MQAPFSWHAGFSQPLRELGLPLPRPEGPALELTGRRSRRAAAESCWLRRTGRFGHILPVRRDGSVGSKRELGAARACESYRLPAAPIGCRVTPAGRGWELPGVPGRDPCTPGRLAAVSTSTHPLPWKWMRQQLPSSPEGWKMEQEMPGRSRGSPQSCLPLLGCSPQSRGVSGRAVALVCGASAR